MPKAFLDLVADTLIARHSTNVSKLLIVLPSRRAGLFLRRILASKFDRPVLGPQITVIDQLATDVSGIRKADMLTLQFALYNSYTSVVTRDKDTFENFVKWSGRLLQDYNEIDRYLIDAKRLYANLSDAKKLEAWDVEGETPEMMDLFLKFWNDLHPIYTHYREQLLKDKIGYQGLVYREAAEKMNAPSDWSSFLDSKGAEKMYFLGFNALNEAETKLIRGAVESGLADIFFDVDKLYLDDTEHEAGMFLRRYMNWPHFQKNEFSFVRDSLRAEKRTIELVGVPRQVGMAKAMAEKLSELHVAGEDVTDRLALVLADEGMLLPALNSIPTEFDEVNVTMGLPISQLTLATSVEHLFEAQERAIRLKNVENRRFQIYHKDIERLITQPFGKFLLGEGGAQKARILSASIRKYNAPFLSISKLEEWLPDSSLFISALTEQSPSDLLICTAELLALYHDSENVSVEDLEASKMLHSVCLKLIQLYEKFGIEPDMSTTLHLFRQLQREEKLDFFGEPLQGLQLMGVLETRLLSFEGLVMTNVNEDTLPAGKSDNSFIPYDLKRGLGMPTHREKDAIYAYHFYRLLQGTKHAVLLYNSEAQSIGSGEASRFIEQIRREFSAFQNTTIVESIYTTPVKQNQIAGDFKLERGDYLIEALKKRAENGIAPTHLQAWVKDPSEFYKKYIIGMQEADEVEEVMGDRTMGLVVHQVLEDFYKRFENVTPPTDSDYEVVIKEAPKLLREVYKKENGRPLEETGRNGLIAHAMVEMTVGFLKEERKRASQYVKEGIDWRVVGVESKFRETIEVDGVDFPILLKGTADRIDRVGNKLVVIDYKTGMASEDDVSAPDLETFAESEKKGKGLQLFAYAWLASKAFPEVKEFSAGIYALRDNNAGLVEAGIKPYRQEARTDINLDDLQTFEQVLTSMLQDIFSTEGVIEPKHKEEDES
ncbi:MAG: PD-(D/E)XK nuclease family protein [Flavobacteriia bacterium]|nr:PD-(D/E)XK nuclease family protein [Flavobacteriia bacterium]